MSTHPAHINCHLVRSVMHMAYHAEFDHSLSHLYGKQKQNLPHEPRYAVGGLLKIYRFTRGSTPNFSSTFCPLQDLVSIRYHAAGIITYNTCVPQ